MIGILNKIIELMAGILNLVISLLPDSPFQAISFPDTGFWGWIGLFIPVTAILELFTAWLSAISIWYGLRWVFRFVKYIE